ncbi:MAG: tetratricopeptide repeat protein, partial [Myxococcota bacterium]
GLDLEARGELEQAIVHYRRALALDPGDARARELLGAAAGAP